MLELSLTAIGRSTLADSPTMKASVISNNIRNQCARRVTGMLGKWFTQNRIKAENPTTRIRGVPMINEDQLRRTWFECCRRFIFQLRRGLDKFRQTPKMPEMAEECQNQCRIITIAKTLTTVGVIQTLIFADQANQSG